MSRLDETLSAIVSVDPAVGEATQALLDNKTKPRGSLGELESLARRIAVIRGEEKPAVLPAAVVVMGADHGVAASGVSAFPQAVTGQMLLNFAGGGAAINVLARAAGARLVVANLGTLEPLNGVEQVRDLRVGPGTKDFTQGPAMTDTQLRQALEHGIALADELAEQGVGIVALGEMGIGNTTAASALAAAYTGSTAGDVVGRGTGVDDAGLDRKRAAVVKALELHHPDANDGLGVLARLGGFEIAGLAGLALGAAARRMVVLLDGFISASAGLAAARICPTAAQYMMASHCSVERGHKRVLGALDLVPLFDLRLRLGEGSGAALALPWLLSSLRILNEMSTFADAGVSDSGA